MTFQMTVTDPCHPSQGTMSTPGHKFIVNTFVKGTFCSEDMHVCLKDWDGLRRGDLIEIFPNESNKTRLVLKVSCGEKHQKGLPQSGRAPIIYIESTIAKTFSLNQFTEVMVQIADKSKVTLDSVELMFNNQYLSRSVMWRLKSDMVNECVYLKKKIEFYGFRCDVFEMWARGMKVTSGLIGPDTKVVYRSASSQVFLFLQMSSEMWDFDINGDLYFEKAVNGFLSDLFEKWKRLKCCHDVTIVMFSRTYYDAKDKEEFPDWMRGCLQQDHRGRFYEDYYRVAIQNERYEDWSHVLIHLKRLFNMYEEEVIQYHQQQGDVRIPKAHNSSASQGNVLEVLNISLNVFEKHNVDRSFDRTGQLSVVISPGVGVFEVDFDLTNITKQRIIDNGIGSDLVCLGEQPLHAVPLFKFNRKGSSESSMSAADVYNMPHWINLSFYSSSTPSTLNSFIPRIVPLTYKMPASPKDTPCSPSNEEKCHTGMYRSPNRDNSNNSNQQPNMIPIDYDEYDAQVFRPSAPAAAVPVLPTARRKSFINSPQSRGKNMTDKQTGRHRRASEYWSSDCHDDDDLQNDHMLSMDDFVTTGIEIKQRRTSSSNSQNLSSSVGDHPISNVKQKIQSKDDISLLPSCLPRTSRSQMHRPKALINPFDPSQVTIKLTSNRRRWTHVFPLAASGTFMQQHHYQAVPQNTACTLLPSAACLDCDKEEARKVSASQIRGSKSKTSPRTSVARDEMNSYRTSVRAYETHSDTMTYAWGATGEQEWTPAITTGVDWKSLVVPACLPITTDFFPDQRSLNNDYQKTNYNLLPEDQGAELLNRVCYRGGDDLRNHIPFSTQQVLEELVCQRLQQGFQLILLPRDIREFGLKSDNNLGNKEYTMSIGRIFHRLRLVDSNCVAITQFKPRHLYAAIKINYCYRFRAPDNQTYGVSWVEFMSERLENYKWNYLDNYICMRGEGDYELEESLKFWRFRLLLLPNICQNITMRITELNDFGERELRCLGAYRETTHSDRIQLFTGFLRFIEILSKIKRPPAPKRMKEITKDQSKRHNNVSVSSQSSRQQSPLSGRLSSSNLVNNKSPKSHSVPDEIDGSVCSTVLASATDGQKPSSLVKSQVSLDDQMSDSKRKIDLPADKVVAEKMKTALNCMMDQKGLPPFSFISGEAIFWAIETFTGIDHELDAMKLFRRMHRAQLIRHCSGDPNMDFVCGFYLYYLTDGKADERSEVDLEMFTKDWVEVEMCLKEVSNPDDMPSTPNTSHNFNKMFTFNKATLDLDTTAPPSPTPVALNAPVMMTTRNKVEKRVEWVHLRYHSRYDPGQAFEIDLDWLVATGHVISDIVTNWSRKAVSNQLHIVPIPNDPFALPFVGKSDPLRGPIYIKLNLACLPHMLRAEELIQFREKILVKWGFLPFFEPNKNQKQYVHVSGSMFVMIPRKSDRSELESKNSTEIDLHEVYINRHFTGLKQNVDDDKQSKVFKTGFLWSWNYMITKRWKNMATGDEAFMRRVMDDFNRFCSNEKNRLLIFYNENMKSAINETTIRREP